MTKEKILIIGGSGFLGSHVSDSLTEKGFQVTIFDQKNLNSSPKIKNLYKEVF